MTVNPRTDTEKDALLSTPIEHIDMTAFDARTHEHHTVGDARRPEDPVTRVVLPAAHEWRHDGLGRDA